MYTSDFVALSCFFYNHFSEFISLISLFLFSCAPSPVQIGLENFSYHNRAREQFLTLGMSKDDVLKAMDSNAKAIMKEGRILSNHYFISNYFYTN